MAFGGDKKKTRKPNYRMEELEVLVEDVAVNKQLLLGKFSDTTTNERKKKVWKNISAKMSAVGDTKRCSDDVRKKWQDWSSQVKGKKCRLVRSYRATGGGPEEAPKLTAIEEKILAIIGPTAVNGLPSTSDTYFDTFNIHPRSVELTCNETIDSDCDDDLSQTNAMGSNSNDEDQSELDSINNNKKTCNSDDENEEQTALEHKIDQQIRKVVSESERKKKLGADTKFSKLKANMVKSKLQNDRKRRLSHEVHVIKIEDDDEKTTKIMNFEKERLDVEKQRLSVEEQRLEIEKERLKVETKLQNDISQLLVIKKIEESDKSQSTITYSSNTSNVVCTDNSESPSQWYRNFGSSDHNQQEESTYTSL